MQTYSRIVANLLANTHLEAPLGLGGPWGGYPYRASSRLYSPPKEGVPWAWASASASSRSSRRTRPGSARRSRGSRPLRLPSISRFLPTFTDSSDFLGRLLVRSRGLFLTLFLYSYMLLFKHARVFFSRFLLSRNHKIQIVARVERKSAVVLSGIMEASYSHVFIGIDSRENWNN